MLVQSDPDTIALAEAVESRFVEFVSTYRRVHGTEIPISQSLHSDLLRWREMRLRHARGDFRNSDDELKATKVIAQWTLDINCELRGQPKKTLEWKE